MFVLAAFVIFSAALAGAAWYVWVVPRRQEESLLDARLRGVRTSRGGSRNGNDLLRRERAGTLEFLGSYIGWLHIAKRLQTRIDQANLHGVPWMWWESRPSYC